MHTRRTFVKSKQVKNCEGVLKRVKHLEMQEMAYESVLQRQRCLYTQLWISD